MNKACNTDTPNSTLCWSCQTATAIPLFFCSTCQTVQPPKTCSPFTLLGIHAGLAIDLNALEERYLELQRQLHPDCFIKASATEQLYATQQTARVNVAYENLKNPLTRAENFITLMAHEEREDQVSGEFLMQLMETREELENAESLEILRNLEAKVKSSYEQAWDHLQKSCQDEAWPKAQKQLVCARYWEKMERKVSSKLATMEIC